MFRKIRSKGGLMALLVCLAVCATLVLPGCGSQPVTGPAGQEVIELKVAHFWPSTHEVETKVVTEWGQEVSKATNGRVKITTYPGETLLKAAAVYDGVVNGIADIGLSCFAYNTGRFPVMEAAMIPGITYNNAKVASKVITDAAKQLNPKELQDTHVILMWAAGNGDLLMKEPVRSLADLKGKEIGVTSGPRAQAIQALGGAPVTLPMSEMYEAQSKGVIKGNLAPIEVLKGFRLADVTKYITKTPFLYNQVYFMTMNLNKWNSLPPDIQKAITETSEKYWNEHVIGLWDEINETGLKFAQEQNNVQVLELPQDEIPVWIDKCQPVLADHIKVMDQQGINGQQVMDTIKQLADKYNKEYP